MGRRVKSQSKWIAIREEGRLPEPYDDVWVWVEYPSGVGRAEETWRNGDGTWQIEAGARATHWQHMPEQPQHRDAFPYIAKRLGLTPKHIGMYDHRDELKAKGLCTSGCGEKAKPGYIRCEACLEKDRKRHGDRAVAKAIT